MVTFPSSLYTRRRCSSISSHGIFFLVNLGSRVISHDYLYINPFRGHPTLLLNRASLQSIRPYSRGQHSLCLNDAVHPHCNIPHRRCWDRDHCHSDCHRHWLHPYSIPTRQLDQLCHTESRVLSALLLGVCTTGKQPQLCIQSFGLYNGAFHPDLFQRP
jgi:hypothetical protein